MPDGRTPTLVVYHSSVGTVTMTEVTSAYPFPAVQSERVVEDRRTRRSSSGAGKTIEVFRPWEGSEESLEFQATLPRAEALKLRAMHRSDPPSVQVSYYGETWDGTLRRFQMPPEELSDENDATGPLECLVSGLLKRSSS